MYLMFGQQGEVDLVALATHCVRAPG